MVTGPVKFEKELRVSLHDGREFILDLGGSGAWYGVIDQDKVLVWCHAAIEGPAPALEAPIAAAVLEALFRVFPLVEEGLSNAVTWRHANGSVRTDHMDAQPGDYFGDSPLLASFAQVQRFHKRLGILVLVLMFGITAVAVLPAHFHHWLRVWLVTTVVVQILYGMLWFVILRPREEGE